MNTPTRAASNSGCKGNTSLFVVTFLNFLSMSLFSPLINTQIRQFRISAFTVGTVGSIFGFTQFLTIPLVYYGTERYGALRMYRFAIILTATNNFIQVLTMSPILFIVARSTAGLCKHTTTLGRTLLIELEERKEVPYAIGNFITCCHLGVIIGPLIGGYLIQRENAGYWICCFSAGLYVVCFAIMSTFNTGSSQDIDFEESNHTKLENDNMTLCQKLSTLFSINDNSAIVKLLLTFFVVFANQTIRASFSLILIEKYGASVSDISYLNSLQSLISVLAGFLVRPILSKHYSGDYRTALIHFGIMHVMSFIGQTISSNFFIAGFSILLLEVASAFIWVAIAGVILESKGKVRSISMAKDMVGYLAIISGSMCAGICQSINFMNHDGAPSLGACASFVAVLFTFLIPTKIKSE